MIVLVKNGGTLDHQNRPKVRLIDPSQAFPESFHTALMDAVMCVLTKDEVCTQADWFPEDSGYVVPKGHIISLIKGKVPDEDVQHVETDWAPYIPLPHAACEIVE